MAGRSRSRVDGLIERVLIDDPALREGLDLSQVSDEFRAMLGYEVRQLRCVCEKVEYYTGRIEVVSAYAGAILPPGWGWCPGSTAAVDMKSPAASPNAATVTCAPC